ncbi:hypothetical protein N0V87_005694 [Didymella glomerata]|uniref:Zn(2)-C6 fungal-type domain-containing protein n=1 Tax=Didymella glomerata TaxID=749621 RepID=A0A9W8WYV8_9PLEO|nr:hypothetical protein N0V87_005694 [Didymella glomerata]
MPPKRTWSQVTDNGPSLSPSASRPRQSDGFEATTPAISRKVKACAACRKQKIKCIMDENAGPPCKRCAERNLSCVLNKSLQTLIDERSQWKHEVVGDLGLIHSSLQHVLSKLSLPALPPLKASTADDSDPIHQYDAADREEEVPSCDNSPRLSPKGDALPHAPIESLYQLTRLRALRSDDPAEERKPTPDFAANHPVNDFISRGIVNVEDAERLFNFFLNRIDHFMYRIGSHKYRDLSSLRRGSSVLTVTICTVAALHDPHSNHLYKACSREFRRLMSASMFDRRIDRDRMRALCVASYWLHDLSWTISGYAIRRAMEINLSSSYHRVLATGDENSMECIRLWYVLYICDRHLSILYGRPSIVRDEVSITGWEALMRTPAFTEADKRLVSQMALLIIMGNARELFGPDTGEAIPKAFAPQLTSFSRQIDHWMGFWSTELLKIHQFIGGFPTKGVIIHHHLAKLHLHSHVFRGLRGAPVPPHFQESAVAAVSAATDTIEMVLTDHDIQEGLVGIPHYIHSMVAFACAFLLNIASQYSGQYITDTAVFDLTTKAVQQFRSTPVGKWHLVHLMAEGLEKMIAKKGGSPAARMLPSLPSETSQSGAPNGSALSTPHIGGSYGDNLFSGFEDAYNLGTTSFLNFDTGTIDLDFAGFSF